MSRATLPLIVAAAGVGFGHAIMPDHWLPLAVVGRIRRYPLGRVARLSGLAGMAHVLVSLLLGAVIIVVGLEFRSTLQHAQDTIVGALLLATGAGFVALELSGRGRGHAHGHAHGHHTQAEPPHSHGQHEPHARWRGVAAIMVPFGAAASPDLTILPVFLAATAAGSATAVGTLIAFGLVTVATIVGLTLLATFGGYQVRGKWLDRWGNGITAAVLLVIGSLVLVGAI